MSMDENVIQKPVIEVCYGPECSDCDGRELADVLKALGLSVVEGDCRDQCPNAPLAYVNNRMVVEATPERVQNKIQSLQVESQSSD